MQLRTGDETDSNPFNLDKTTFRVLELAVTNPRTLVAKLKKHKTAVGTGNDYVEFSAIEELAVVEQSRLSACQPPRVRLQLLQLELASW